MGTRSYCVPEAYRKEQDHSLYANGGTVIEVQSYKDGELYTDWRPSALEAGSAEYRVIEDMLEESDEPVVFHGGMWEFHYRKAQ
jgi:hypothetical protein